jgi:cytochrome c
MIRIAVAVLGLSLLAGSAGAAGDATKGGALFQAQCAMCHAPESGAAPSLVGVVGRKAGALPGFAYSPAMRKSGIVWTPAQLNAFLTDPGKKVPGTMMMIPGPEPAERADIIAYLATLHP